MSAFNLLHQVRLPLEPQSAPPVIILVHGWLGNETVMWAFERALPPQALVLSVRAPFAAEGGYGWMVPGDEGSFSRGLAALQEYVQRLPEEFTIEDVNKRLVMGFSQGAAMSYALLLASPELVAGVAGLAGFLPEPARPWAVPGRLTGKKILIAHGTEDPTVPLAEAESAREAFAASGAEVTYVTDPTGHKVGVQGMRILKNWLTDMT